MKTGVNQSSIFRELYRQPYDELTRVKLYKSTKGSLDIIQRLSLLKNLPVHGGCVNSICWNETGEYILSGSDDLKLVVTSGYSYKVLTDYKTSHRANIFSAKFLPSRGDSHIISCSGDGIILYTDLVKQKETFHNQFNCHSGTTYEVITVPGDPNSFLSCGEDGTVRWFDLRVKDKCNKPQCTEDVMISCKRAVTALSVNPVAPYQLAIGCSDSTVRMFDRRKLVTKASGGSDASGVLRPICSFTAPNFEERSYRITSLEFSPEGEEVLVSYSSDHLYLFGIKDYGSTKLKIEAGMKERNLRSLQRSPPPVRRLRLRGDWSDTGPDARPEREGGRQGEVAQARPTLQATLMQRMTDVLSRMLSDPATRAALSGGGEDAVGGEQALSHSAVPTVPTQPPDPVPSTSATTSNIPPQEPEQQASGDSPLAKKPRKNSEGETQETNDNNSYPVFVLPELEKDIKIRLPRCDEDENFRSGGEGHTRRPYVITEEGNRVQVGNETNDHQDQNEQENARGDGAGEMDQNVSSTSESSCNEMQENPNLLQDSNMVNSISNLQDQLCTMREGFIERHGIEPAVSLTYSDQSSSSGFISLNVGDEVSREVHPISDNQEMEDMNLDADEPFDSPNNEPVDAVPGPSFAHNSQSSPHLEGEDVYNDSDDEDIIVAESARLIHPIEEHIDHAIASTRNDRESMFDENCSFQPSVKQKYTGHRNARTMIKEATFWGSDYVLSGSDCGHVFIWDRHSSALVMLLEADHHVVNCLQPHPVFPILATSGIDYDIKLWAPVNDEPCFAQEMADVITKRNAIMLEETKDTITVPASFMIRMLACLNQIRRGGRSRTRARRQASSED